MRQGPWVSGGNSELIFGRGVVRDEMWGVRLARGALVGLVLGWGICMARLGWGILPTSDNTSLPALYRARAAGSAVDRRRVRPPRPPAASAGQSPRRTGQTCAATCECSSRQRRQRQQRGSTVVVSAMALLIACDGYTCPTATCAHMHDARHHDDDQVAHRATTAPPPTRVRCAPRGRARCVKTCL